MSPLDHLSALTNHRMARRCSTLGHGLTRVAAGVQTLRQRLAKGSLNAIDGSRWTASWLSDTATQVSTTRITWTDHGWRVVPAMETDTLRLPLPPDTLALLHLPALRAFWIKELRRQRFERLRRVLPEAWPVLPDALPPGAVIAGLGLSSWEDLPALLAAGQRFAVTALSETASDTDVNVQYLHAANAHAWPAWLQRSQAERIVLVKLPAMLDRVAELSWHTDADGQVELAAVQELPIPA